MTKIAWYGDPFYWFLIGIYCLITGCFSLVYVTVAAKEIKVDLDVSLFTVAFIGGWFVWWYEIYELIYYRKHKGKKHRG